MFKSKKKKILLLDINGTISASESGSLLGKKKYNHQKTLDLLREFDYDGLLVRFNSPGGTTGASEELMKAILEVRQSGVPVVGSVADVAASGAYMAATACTRIFANEMALVGSIGVIMQIPNYQELAHKLGVAITTVKSGRMKDIGNPTREMTEEEREYLEALAKESHKIFIDIVRRNRNLDSIEEDIVDGRVLSVQVALKHGLIDEIGTYHDALGYLCRQLGTDEKDIKLIEPEESKGILGTLLEQLQACFPMPGMEMR